jgi:exonuclease SbcC
MDAKSGSRSEAASLRAALEALEAEKAESDATKADTEKALADAAASLAQAQEETARAQAEATAAREAEDAALSTAARELEAADATRAALESTLRGEVEAEKARCAAMKSSLERARGRVVDAEKTAKLAKEETAGLSLRLRMAEEALSEARAGNEKMGFAEQKQLTLEIERRVAVEQALDETERRCVVLDAESGALRASLARAETNAENAVRALEQERSAAKELDEAATMALGEVERLAADAARLEKALAEQTALTDEARVDLEMTREELAEACRVSGADKENKETRDDRFVSARADKSEEVSPLSPGFAVKASTAMRASRKPAEAAPAAVARAERVVEEEAAEGVDALVVASAATQSAVVETVAVAVDAAAGETLSEEPKKRGRGRPKKARTEAEQRFVDLKAKKRAAPSAPFETTGAADEENAGASVGVGFSLKSLIIAAGVSKVSKKRPALGAADANASDAAKAKETERLPAARKRRRLAAVSSLRDVIGSPLENGRFLR